MDGSVCDCQNKSLVIQEPSVMKSRFLFNNIRNNAARNLGRVLILPTLPSHFLDCRVHPKGLGIVVDKKIAKYSMLGGLYGSEFNKI